MSLDNEDERAMEASEAINESQKKPTIAYTRDFLLSLSELDICKRLPSGFDQSILSEFEDTSHGAQDRPRSHGSLPLQGFRRNDYSSSPPTRGDSTSFSRGGYGRWDNRSSGWTDKDGDSQSDLDSDSGRRNYGNQSRRPWQNSEHDGLLGSGSFPRPSGFSAGTSAPKGQTNEPYHLNRSTEAYHPPRPFKAVPNPRTSTHDSFNDETFGSSENTSQDRAEEERKRRASFELMRKEQQKVLQEKQKSSVNKHTNDCFTDLILEETKEGLSEANGELNSSIQSVPNDDTAKSSFSLQSSKPRPLVPPGFRSTKPVISSIDKENPIPRPDRENIKTVHKLDITDPHPEDKNISGLKMGETIMNSLGFPEVVHEAVDGGEVFDLITNKVIGNNILSNPSQESSTSILGKLFGSAPTIKNGGFIEPQESKPDDTFSPRNVQSSKFAQWFNEDEKKPEDALSSGRPNDLLSLIVGGDKAGSQVPNIISTEHILPEVSYKGPEITKIPSDSAPPVAKILTCEDLEQTILSEYSENSLTLQPPVPDWTGSGQENMDSKAVDNHATHHLLSLLQKDVKSDNINAGPSEDHPIMMFDKSKQAKPDELGQNLTLETLFGSAFMKELHSAQAPVSVQRGELGDGTGSNVINYENTLVKQPSSSDNVESWLNPDPFLEFPKSTKQTEIHLPEEESLFITPVNETFDISKKLAALNSGFRGDRSMARGPGPGPSPGPYDVLEPERQFNNLHNRRPMFKPFDPNADMRFPEHIMQRDNTSNQQFVANPNMIRPFHHPDNRVTGFDVPGRPQMLPQMNNFPPAHLLRDFPRPLQVHPHQSNQSSGFVPDREMMHGFPFAQRQMPLPGPDGSSGSNHPEALQRMMEMELRARSKQIRPNPTYGHELDMGFRYR